MNAVAPQSSKSSLATGKRIEFAGKKIVQVVYAAQGVIVFNNVEAFELTRESLLHIRRAVGQALAAAGLCR